MGEIRRLRWHRREVKRVRCARKLTGFETDQLSLPALAGTAGTRQETELSVEPSCQAVLEMDQWYCALELLTDQSRSNLFQLALSGGGVSASNGTLLSHFPMSACVPTAKPSMLCP